MYTILSENASLEDIEQNNAVDWVLVKIYKQGPGQRVYLGKLIVGDPILEKAKELVDFLNNTLDSG